VLGTRSGRELRLREATLADAVPLEADCPHGSASATELLRAARLRQGLAVEQARAGELADASRTVEGVVRIYRRLVLSGAPRHRPELAEALSCWGVWSSRLGRREHACAALSDAVELYRDELDRVPITRPATRVRLRVGLAVALGNLGLARCDLGEHEEALAAAEESVRMLRELRERSPVYRLFAWRDPVGSRHCLATAVNNLGIVVAERGDRERAHRLAARAVRIYRELASLAPVRFEFALARALHNLGMACAEASRPTEALAASRESVELHRCLVVTDGVGHQHHLGHSLCAFAQIRAVQRVELDEALAAAREAVTLYEELVGRRPEAFSGDLRAAYCTAAQVRSANGH